MRIEDLINRFEFYAINHPEIKHNPAIRSGCAFLNLDLESLQDATTSGLKFPAILIQTPSVEKGGNYDTLNEAFSFTYIVLNSSRKKQKLELISQAKSISDTILSRFLSDVQSLDFLYGVIDGSDEGAFGPANEIYGWAVSLVVSTPFDGELKAENWLDLMEVQP